MKAYIRRWLSFQLTLCCILMLVLGAGVSAAGLQSQKNGAAELVSASSESHSVPLSSAPRFIGKRMTLREMQQFFTVHRTDEASELYERLSESEGPRLDLLSVLLSCEKDFLQSKISALWIDGLPEFLTLLENVRFERLIN